MFTIDGVQYNVECSIERTAEIKLSDISGMLMDGHIFNDVLGNGRYFLGGIMPVTDFGSLLSSFLQRDQLCSL